MRSSRQAHRPRRRSAPSRRTTDGSRRRRTPARRSPPRSRRHRRPSASEAATSSVRAAPRRERNGGRANGSREDRGRQVAGTEGVGDEQDRHGVGACCGTAEDEALSQPDAVRREPDADGSEPREQPGLRARHGLGRGQEPGTEKGEGESGDGGGSDAGNGLLEDEVRRRIHEEHVRRSDGAIGEGGRLQARIAEPRAAIQDEEQRLGGPGDSEARSRKHVGGGDGRKRQGRHAQHECEGRLPASEQRSRQRPRPRPRRRARCRRCGRRPTAAEREGARGRPRQARTSSRADRGPSSSETSCSQIPAASTTSTNDATTAVIPAPAAASASSASQATCAPTTAAIPISKRVPAARHGERHCRGENDHGECRRRPRQLRVDCLQGRGESRPEQPDRRDRLGRPRDRDDDSERREATGKRKREPVGHDVVSGSRGGQRRVATGDTCAGGSERHLQLAVTRPHPERRADREPPKRRHRTATRIAA